MLGLCFSLFFLLFGVNCDDASHHEPNPYMDILAKYQWEMVQNYTEVRPGVHMFYWFYYADGKSLNAASKPLIIWIQGGPGLAASGVGNFGEIGPLDLELKLRNHTWMNGHNLLLIDHPVGTGFSYATNLTLLAKTDRTIALDLVGTIKNFMKRYKIFRTTPTYLFGQSYGGKMTPRVAYYLHKEIEKKRLVMNLKGIGIGSGWVDPKESTLEQPEILYQMGMLDRRQYMTARKLTRQIRWNINKKKYYFSRFQDHMMLVHECAGRSFNFDNFQKPSSLFSLNEFQKKMNKFVLPTMKHLVDQRFQWRYLNEIVYSHLTSNFMASSSSFLEMLLNETSIKVAVYNGNLDITTPIAGAVNWVHKLKWPGAEEFASAARYSLGPHGYYKEAQQLSFWWVFNSGHWIPEDNPTAMQYILDYVINDKREDQNPKSRRSCSLVEAKALLRNEDYEKL